MLRHVILFVMLEGIKVKAYDLKTEYLRNPLGIDSVKKQLSWKVSDGKRQKSFEIRLSVNDGEWENMEWVETSVMSMVLDRCFSSRDHVLWQIRIMDENGKIGDWSETAEFEMGLLNIHDWSAKWIMGNYEHETDEKVRYPVDCFRKEIGLQKAVKRARLYMTACGMYVTFLGGKKVGDLVLAPGSTAFQKRTQYQTFDVTELIQSISGSVFNWDIELADGFYASRTGVFGKAKIYGYEPKVMGQLEIIYEDGAKDKIVTDESFSWSNDGAVRSADMKDGEVVDYNLSPSYKGKARVTTYAGMVCASNNVSVKEMERFNDPRLIRCPDGNVVLDFGQNIAGYVQVSVQGRKNHKCSMVFGERLNEEGNFSYANISWEGEYTKCHFQTIDIICSGEKHTYKPKFTVMGFQYVLLLNWPEEVKGENFTAIAVYSDMDTTFTFESSDAGLNQIVKNTFWSMKGNFLDVPTDCPTRERAGWTGDAQLFFNTGNYMMDQRAFFRKWLRDVADCQKENGLVYNVNPANPKGPEIMEWLSVEGSAGWGDAMIMIPYYFWKRYGDDTLIREFWEPMEKCFSFYKKRMGKRNFLSLYHPKHSKYDKYLCASGRDFGEWTEPDDCAPPKWKMMIPMAEEATAYLSYTAGMMYRMAHHLGRRLDEEEYQKVAVNTAKAYNYYFVKNGRITSNRMCKYVRPCGLELAKGKARELLLKKIVELNRTRNYKIGTGFLATPFVFELLSEAGESNDAFRMLMNPELGWMQQVNLGATTVWENWTPDASLNHYSKGACCQWIFDCLCGVKLNGRKNHFVIEPHTVDSLEYISFVYDSVYGTVKSSWRHTERGQIFSMSIPPNCTADIVLPNGQRETVDAGEYQFTI